MNPILDGILTLEGDYVYHPKDLGGETHWGITEAAARANDYVGDMKELTRAEAYTILEKMYWIKPGFEKISRISWAVSFELCDAAVNIGPHYPCTWLQRWLNALNREQSFYQDIEADGIIGKKTLEMLSAFLNIRGKEGEKVLLKALNCSQGAYYLSITESRSANEEFIYGWLKNRVT